MSANVTSAAHSPNSSVLVLGNGSGLSNGGSFSSTGPGGVAHADPFAGKTIYDFELLDGEHGLYDLEQHRGSVLLLVNVASRCQEYTLPAYRSLNALYGKFKDQGFTIIALPCNQFGSGEPGTNDEIAENIADLEGDVGPITFPIMSKIDVNGESELPLYGFLKSRVKGTMGQGAIRWNFTSFVIDRAGNPVYRLAPDATLQELEAVVASTNGATGKEGEGVEAAAAAAAQLVKDNRSASPPSHPGAETPPPGP